MRGIKNALFIARMLSFYDMQVFMINYRMILNFN